MPSVFWLIYQSLTFPHNWSGQQKCGHCTVTDGYPDTEECNSILQEPWKLLNQCGATLNIDSVTSLLKHKAQIRNSGMKYSFKTEHVKWKKTEKKPNVFLCLQRKQEREDGRHGWFTNFPFHSSLKKMLVLTRCRP